MWRFEMLNIGCVTCDIDIIFLLSFYDIYNNWLRFLSTRSQKWHLLFCSPDRLRYFGFFWINSLDAHKVLIYQALGPRWPSSLHIRQLCGRSGFNSPTIRLVSKQQRHKNRMEARSK